LPLALEFIGRPGQDSMPRQRVAAEPHLHARHSGLGDGGPRLALEPVDQRGAAAHGIMGEPGHHCDGGEADEKLGESGHRELPRALS
jgi:hypothetical protein